MKNPSISLWQPWAMLWALGEKQFETRHWQFPRALEGQTINIHAAQKWNKDLANLCGEFPFADAFKQHRDIVGINAPESPNVQYRNIAIHTFESIKLPFGCIIGTVRLVHDLDVWAALELMDQKRRPVESGLGNYDDGRRAWIGKEHTVLPQFIPYVGKQGFFDFKSNK
jgi:hypothetical protein